MFCMIWYHLHNLKNAKNTHGGMLLLVKSQVSAAKLQTSRFLNYKNVIKSRKASHFIYTTFSRLFWDFKASHFQSNIWVKVFKNGQSKICEKQSLKNLKRFKFLKGCLPQIFLGPLLNTLIHIVLGRNTARWYVTLLFIVIY